MYLNVFTRPNLLHYLRRHVSQLVPNSKPGLVATDNVTTTHNVKSVTLCGLLQHYTSMIQSIMLHSTHNVAAFLTHNVTPLQRKML